MGMLFRKYANIVLLVAFFGSTSAYADWDYDYFEGSWTQLPDFNSLTPVQSGVAAEVGTSLRLQNDFFAFRFTNVLTVTTAGLYQFSTNSDDGSAMYIAGNQIIDNDGLHGAVLVTGSVNLNPGTYVIEVTMFERTGGDLLEVAYAPPGSGFRVIPADGILDGPDQLSTAGSWGPVIPWPHVPVSAANMPDGRVLTWASNERFSFPGGRPEYTFTGIWDPQDNSILEIDHPSHDMFCAHQVMLEDGQVFVAGGRNSAQSIWTSVFDDNTNQWVPQTTMTRGRWYPTSVALGDGKVFIAIGSGGGNTGEVYDPTNQTWTDSGLNFNPMILDYPSNNYGERNWWPLLNLAPDGSVFHSGPTPQMHSIDFDGTTGTAVEVGPEFNDWYPKHGSTIMYDEGKLLTAGGWTDGSTLSSTNEAVTIDFNGPSPVIQPAQAMVHNRKFHNGVMLPNGEVLVVGGNTSGLKFNDTGSVYAGEIWNPQTGQWREVASAAIPRNYHSVALLLTDGTVLSAGGGLCSNSCAVNHPDGQVYSPPYLFNPDNTPATRPVVNAGPAVIRTGDTFHIDTDSDITKFSLIKMSSTTHGVNTDVRFLDVAFTGSAGSYDLSAHTNPNVLTAGYWMLFALNAQGTPSVAHVLQVRMPNDEDPDPENTLNFQFTSFADLSPFQVNGDAATNASALRLSSTTPDSTGSVFYRTPFSIGQNATFVSEFSFSVNGSADGQEGLAFILQGNEATSLGNGASGIGYDTIPNSLVIEVDNNDSGASDPNANHIAVHIGGDADNATASYAVPFDLEDGVLHRMWVEYFGNTNTLQVFIAQNDAAAKPATAVITLNNIDLNAIVGSLGYFGFTGASGAIGNNHDVENWALAATQGGTPLSVNALPALPQVDGSQVVFSGSAQGDGLEYSWIYGDGTAPTAFSSSPQADHTYAGPGRYTVTLIVRDIYGGEQSITFVQAIHPPVSAQAPSASSTILVESTTGLERVWNVNPDNDTVTVSNADMFAKLAEIAVGEDPRSLALAPNNTVWVVNKDAATISIIDATTNAVSQTRTLPAGSRPHGIVFDEIAGVAYVVLEQLGEIWKLDVYTDTVIDTLAVGVDARHISITGDGDSLFVSRFITPPLPGEATAAPQTTLNGSPVGGEVLRIDALGFNIAATVTLQHSNRQAAELTGPGFPNYVGPAIVAPSGQRAWVPSKQDNVLLGERRVNPSPLNHEHTVRAVTSVFDLTASLDDISNRVDHDNASVARNGVFDPYGVYLFVALEGNRQVAVIDALQYEELFRFDVGFAPQSIARSANGKRLFVHNFMERSVSVIDVADLLDGLSSSAISLATINTVAGEDLPAEVLLGKRLFYDARDPRLARDSYMACASCHNDGGQDGRVWDLSTFGEGLRNTITLKGHGGMAHGTLHWSANFDEVQDFENQIREFAGGTGLMSETDFLATQDVLGTPKAGLSADLDALAAYLASLSASEVSPYRQANGDLTAAGVDGKALFDANNCGSCHSGNTFTDSPGGASHDIGTITALSGQRLNGGPLTSLDTPTLKGLWATAPYLHDGSALTVSNAIAAHSPSSLGGVSLTPTERDSLASYLLQIDDRENPASSLNLINQDVGNVAAAGSTVNNNGTYTMQGSGADIWKRLDEFQFAYQTLDGDGEIIARLASLGPFFEWSKAGIMMRESLDSNSRFAFVMVSEENGAALNWRATPGINAVPSGAQDGTTAAPVWLRLVREGDTYTGYLSNDGNNWVLDDQITLSMGSSVYVGLAITSHVDGALNTAVFDNVSITPTNPPQPDVTPPSVPQGLATNPQSTTAIDLSWAASNDPESGVAGYRVFRDSVQVAEVTGTAYSDTGLAASSTYSYTVLAFNNANPSLASAQSLAVLGSTLNEVFVNVPAVVGETQASAIGLITTAGLAIGNVTQANSSTVAAGLVISSNPTAGASALLGSTVDLVVSLGAAPVPAPDVVGIQQVSAVATLNSVGLNAGSITRVISATIPENQVISQNPLAGILVAAGGTVDLVVSDGPPPPDTTPPSVPGGVAAAATGPNTVSVSWSASSDPESGVSGYQIYRDGALLITVAGTSFLDTGLVPNTSYVYTVVAVNNANPPLTSTPSLAANATTDPAPSWTSQDIGAVAAAGSMVDNNGTITMQASGADIWKRLDEFHFAYQSLDGDGEIVARLASLGPLFEWSKAGIMMRESLTSNSRFAFVMVSEGNGAALNWRSEPGINAVPSGAQDGITVAPTWVRLVREGNTFTGYLSTDGVNWVFDDQITLNMPTTLYVGLALTSHVDGTLNTAVFDNVSVTPASPPVPDTTPPSVPANLTATATGMTSIDLAWDAAIDNESNVAGYRLFRNGTLISTLIGTSYSDTGLQASTSYNYTVLAYNDATPALESAQSGATVGRTDDPPPPDVTPPSVPVGVAAVAAGPNGINVSWQVSVDPESGVEGYRIYRGGQLIADIAGTAYADNGLLPNTAYTYTVAAYNAAVPELVSVQSAPANATTASPPLWSNQDIGNVAAVGSMTDNNGTITVQASGADIWKRRDEFHYVYQTLDGDGQITARLASLGPLFEWSKAGVMMRNTLEDDSRFAFMMISEGHGAALQYRTTEGVNAVPSGAQDEVTSAPYWVRVVREGNQFSGYISPDGVNWTLYDQATIVMGQTLFIGLAVTSHVDGTLINAVFDSVSVTAAP